MEILENIPLAPLTTFRIGGQARYFAEARTEDDIQAALRHARRHELRVVILGGGSNMLVADNGFDGLVIRMAGTRFAFEGDRVRADAGGNLLALIQESSRRRLGGWEKLAGIPGTIGGAVRGNAGAFGTEIKDVASAVRALHASTGEVREFQNRECEFSYRHSFFKDHPQWIITTVQVQLAPAEAAQVRQTIQETITERERRHLQNVRAAGSYFKNPVAPRPVQELFEREKGVSAREGRAPAGWLIEKAGMKGAQEGGAKASERHPNYLLNESGNARAKDVCALAHRIKEAVQIQFGIELVEEVSHCGT